MDFQNFQSHIKLAGHFTEEEIEAFVGKIEVLYLAKGEYFLKEGEVSHHIAFVERGIAMHYRAYDGVEVPCDFTVENQWLAYMKSFSNRIPADMNIKALEDTVLFGFSALRLEELFKEYPTFLSLRNFYVEQSFQEMASRSADLTTLDAAQRYYKLMKARPDLIHRVPQYYLAAYLGMKPQSLSRIRKDGGNSK